MQRNEHPGHDSGERSNSSSEPRHLRTSLKLRICEMRLHARGSMYVGTDPLPCTSRVLCTAAFISDEGSPTFCTTKPLCTFRTRTDPQTTTVRKRGGFSCRSTNKKAQITTACNEPEGGSHKIEEWNKILNLLIVPDRNSIFSKKCAFLLENDGSTVVESIGKGRRKYHLIS